MRSKRKKSRFFRRLKSKYLIIVDGQTEVWFFNAWKNRLENVNFDIFPQLAQRTRLEKQYEYIEEQKEYYDKIYWIVDLDVILRQHLLEKFRLLYERAVQKGGKRIVILVNNPCLELWFLLHFKFTERKFSNCDEVEKELKKFLPEYEKSEKFYIKTDTDIVERIEDGKKLIKAIKNAKKLGDFDFDNSDKTIAEIYKLVELFIKLN